MHSANCFCFALLVLVVVISANSQQSVVGSRYGAAIRAQRDTVLEWPSYSEFEPDGPGTYSFGYEIDDPSTGNRQFRKEERSRAGVVKGSFGIYNSDGTITTTHYVSDINGYRPSVSKEKSNIQNQRTGSDARLRPSSNNMLRQTPQKRTPTGPNENRRTTHPVSALHMPTPERKVLFAYPALHESDNLPFRSAQPNNAFFNQNSKLSSLFFTDQYIDGIRGAEQQNGKI